MQNIPFEPFDDLEINFKEINHSDFEKYSFDAVEKTIIFPDEEGYISEKLRECVDLKIKDTTIINAGVGQGKTKAILDFIGWYLEENRTHNEKYKIVIVTPFKSLNQEYIKKIVESTNNKDIFFEYQVLSSIESNELDFEDYFNKSIQIISIKGLLGNPGEKEFKQSDVKRSYFDYLIKKSEEKGEKIVFFFDELHESLDSFTVELLPNLFKWKSIIHKIIVASATFSESSKVPLKFFAELTEKRIKIIESQRIQNQNNLSDLFLCFYNRPTYDVSDSYLNELFKHIININGLTSVNILCYTKEIAKQIFESQIGNLIRSKFGNLNLCIENPKGKLFDSKSCNIGTTFKTGISIERENSGLVILLPPSYSNDTNNLFVFSDRVNAITQAIARVRNKSKIFVVTPPPKKILISENQNKNYIKKLSLGYLDFNIPENQKKYHSPSEQDNLLNTFYQSIKDGIEKEIKEVSNLDDDIKGVFNSYDWYKLKEGDAYLRSKYYSYGKDLPTYVYWAACNNQFVNCKLKAIIKKQPLSFTEGSIQQELDIYFPNKDINEKSFIDTSDKVLYGMLRNELFSNNVYLKKIGQKESKKITPLRNAMFEQQIIHFLQRKKTPYFFEPEHGCSYSLSNGDKPKDVIIEKEKYIRICISQCEEVLEKSNNLPEKEMRIISAYNDFFLFKSILLNEYAIKNKKQVYLLPTDSNFEFKNIHSIKLKTIFTTLMKEDIGFRIFNTKDILENKSMFSLLRKVFFKTKLTTTNEGKFLKIEKEHSLEYFDHRLNLVYDVSEPFVYYPLPPSTEFFTIELEENEDGSIKQSNELINIKVVPITQNR
ncbi:hypothetical protein GGR22_001638 [Flavobacterium gossypii]|uniref:Helicase/UvrB N-terminal domain-containing protein n=1 Tax=Flavobacterium gossypii TaxID=1646119 RepID=A0ABR6DP84_9FLAO|nr:DEAD/DEAH box helicase family protein [Flavobacterium gossypii]MBA9073512.1 hypothetical protein [Flavobacterium gossypii]